MPIYRFATNIAESKISVVPKERRVLSASRLTITTTPAIMTQEQQSPPSNCNGDPAAQGHFQNQESGQNQNQNRNMNYEEDPNQNCAGSEARKYEKADVDKIQELARRQMGISPIRSFKHIQWEWLCDGEPGLAKSMYAKRPWFGLWRQWHDACHQVLSVSDRIDSWTENKFKHDRKRLKNEPRAIDALRRRHHGTPWVPELLQWIEEEQVKEQSRKDEEDRRKRRVLMCAHCGMDTKVRGS